MKPSRQQRVCKALCCSCNCRLSVSSSSEEAESSVSDRFPSVSTLAHAMVQERLDQMIREKNVERRRHYHHHHHHHHQRREEGTKFVVMVAMEKCSHDPREDFRESMVEMINANRLQDAKDLRSLLNYYVSMNSQEYHSLILEVFHEDFIKVEDGMQFKKKLLYKFTDFSRLNKSESIHLHKLNNFANESHF